MENFYEKETQLETDFYEENALINAASKAEIEGARHDERAAIFAKFQQEKDDNFAWLVYKKKCLHNADRRDNWGKNETDPEPPETDTEYLQRVRQRAQKLREQEELTDEEFPEIFAVITLMCKANITAALAGAVADLRPMKKKLITLLHKLAGTKLPPAGGEIITAALKKKMPSPKPKRV